jgi:geranylgeranyl diphosphate synthase type I
MVVMSRSCSRPLGTVRAPTSLLSIAERVDGCLAEVLAAERARWVAVEPDLDGPFEQIDRLVRAGGKRLRPAFCHWGAVAAGAEPGDDRIVQAGAALELVHAFALFHDDVMDGSATRRGVATTHVVYGTAHERAGWAGESRRFGESVAILVGDLAMVLADGLLAGAGRAVWDVWNELRVELTAGQYLDILGAVRRERRIDRAEQVARYKSAKYTVERPLHLGAALAGGDAGRVLWPALSAFGVPLGDAFQLRDDVLGVFGDSAVTGKPVGDDLREGKPTPLLARAVAAADRRQAEILRRVGARDVDDDDVVGIQQVIIDTGALDAVEARIELLAEEAFDALDRAPISRDACDELAALATFVVGRTG